jgi:hypothetical protein
MERTSTLCGHSAEFRNFTINVTYCYHLALKMKVTGLVGLPFLQLGKIMSRLPFTFNLYPANVENRESS